MWHRVSFMNTCRRFEGLLWLHLQVHAANKQPATFCHIPQDVIGVCSAKLNKELRMLNFHGKNKLLLLLLLRDLKLNLSLSLSPTPSLLTYPLRHHPAITYPFVLKARYKSHLKLKESSTMKHRVTVKMSVRGQGRAHRAAVSLRYTNCTYHADKSAARAVWLRNMTPNDFVA